MKKDKSTLMAVAVMAVTAIVALLCDEPSLAQGEIPVLQGWIGAALGAITSIGSGIASAITANQQAKKAKAEADKSEALLQDWYDSQMNTNILDRADTLSMLKMYRDTMDEQNRKFQTNAIKGGASEEAKVAYAQKQNKAKHIVYPNPELKDTYDAVYARYQNLFKALTPMFENTKGE